MPRLWKTIIKIVRRLIERDVLSVLMPHRIPGRIGRKPGHYLHLMDTLETVFPLVFAYSRIWSGYQTIQASIQQDPYDMTDFNQIIKWWLPLTFAVNSLNHQHRSFRFLSFCDFRTSCRKLQFIHELCLRNAGNMNYPRW
jgi:hypothetical protein